MSERPAIETKEHPPKKSKEAFFRTERGAMRAEIVDKNDQELTVRILWTHDGNGVGHLNKIAIQSLEVGKPMRLSISTDAGATYRPEQTSGKLVNFGAWERAEQIAVDSLIYKTDHRTLSDTLPDNPGADLSGDTEKLRESNRPYREALPEYEYIAEAAEYSRTHPSEAKFNFPFGSTNVGWKAHLNVTPANVAKVSEYLKAQGYLHKYLTGGIGSEGAAFTVYFGAKSVIDKWAGQLSKDMEGSLCKPLVSNEVEVAKGVVARFTNIEGSNAAGQEFLQYGTYGMSARRAAITEQGGWNNIKTNEQKQAIARDAFSHLSNQYGSYFHG